jgi:peptidoglycan DL-endopeptidase LytE
LKNLVLWTGVVLFLVFLSPTPSSAAQVVHTVKSGDSLSSISKKYGVPVASLKNINNINGSTKLKLGQTIIVKRDAEVVQTQTGKKKGRPLSTKVRMQEASAPEPSDFIVHKVRRGDTLDNLAEQYNVEKEEIIDLNNMKAGKLKPGKTLLIPRPEQEEEGQEIVILSPKSLKAWKNREEPYMLVKVAKSFMGAPYKFGGESVRGLDCSAYVKKIYDIFDVQLPRSAREQIYAGTPIAKEQLTVGDLVFFKTRRYAKYPTHVGIYIGDGQFIHSSSGHGKIGVKIDALSSDYYSRVYTGATRVKKSPDEFLESSNASDRVGSNS